MIEMIQSLAVFTMIAGTAVGLLTAKVKESDDDNKELQEKIDRVTEALKSTNLKVTQNDTDTFITANSIYVKPDLERYHLEIPHGLSFESLKKKQDIIENALKSKVKLLNDNYQYYLVIEEEQKLKDKYPFEVVPVPCKEELFATVGMTTEGPLTFNISQLPHILLGSTTGAGKSRLLKSILCNLIENYTPQQLELCYLDNKGLECGAFKDVEHLIYRTINIHQTVKYLDELEHEMMRRNRLIESKNKTNIVDYNKVVTENDRIPFRFVVLDELFPFLTLPSKQRNEAYSKLGLLLSMSRASGIHFLISTQKCTTDVLPSLVTANCTVALGLRTRNEQESRNVIGETGLEKISVNTLGRGVAVSHIKQEFQSFWVTDETINQICSKYAQKRPVTSSNKETHNYNQTTKKALQGPKNEIIEGVL